MLLVSRRIDHKYPSTARMEICTPANCIGTRSSRPVSPADTIRSLIIYTLLESSCLFKLNPFPTSRHWYGGLGNPKDTRHKWLSTTYYEERHEQIKKCSFYQKRSLPRFSLRGRSFENTDLQILLKGVVTFRSHPMVVSPDCLDVSNPRDVEKTPDVRCWGLSNEKNIRLREIAVRNSQSFSKAWLAELHMTGDGKKSIY